jgi:hypothetical protein
MGENKLPVDATLDPFAEWRVTLTGAQFKSGKSAARPKAKALNA